MSESSTNFTTARNESDSSASLDRPCIVGASAGVSRAVLIQQASGSHVPLLELTAGRHAAYCARHGITFWSVQGAVQFSRAASWNKIALIQRALELDFDTVAWLDADTLISSKSNIKDFVSQCDSIFVSGDDLVLMKSKVIAAKISAT